MFELDGEARDDGLSKAVNTKRAVTKMGKKGKKRRNSTVNMVQEEKKKAITYTLEKLRSTVNAVLASAVNRYIV
jgi:hypothetical protein